MIVVSGAAKIAAKRAAMKLTPRQLFIGLHAAGFITAEEALAAATIGAMPATVEAAIAGLPEPDKVAARITWARMTVVERTNPLVGMLAAQSGQTDEMIDGFFETYAAI